MTSHSSSPSVEATVEVGRTENPTVFLLKHGLRESVESVKKDLSDVIEDVESIVL